MPLCVRPRLNRSLTPLTNTSSPHTTVLDSVDTPKPLWRFLMAFEWGLAVASLLQYTLRYAVPHHPLRLDVLDARLEGFAATTEPAM